MNEIIIICMTAAVLIGAAVIIFSIINQKKGVFLTMHERNLLPKSPYLEPS